ncbi:hypothetical protein BCR36DRAFT_344588 [Piromyces finnis]|uniref:RING-type domain-containing protein n=1 Tax=Piromyces finnis TaxID=1754191 RepID=A0A1Y1VJE8_9FUNG|nr:hypothetical protein BCR36DRAFT_344588 [Piromyces finnis]|eukprot:ORX57840.1 hypothetical protein BCR36DRAFT_344588 [Piromyces finnis]
MSENSNPHNNSEEQENRSRNQRFFFLPNFMNFTGISRNVTTNTNEEANNNENSNDTYNISNRTENADRPVNMMMQQSNERNDSTNGVESYNRISRNISELDRNSSYGILNSNDSLLSLEDSLYDPTRNEESESSDGSTQSLIEMLDRIHRINVLNRAIEEERRRQQELELDAEMERQRNILINEHNELSSFVNLLNTMILLISAEHRLRRPFMEPLRQNEGEAVEEGEHEERNENRREDEHQTSAFRYVRTNPNPIITTPFMYTRFEPAPDDENEASNESTERERAAYMHPGNVMYVNLPLSFDLANLIQLLTASNSHSHPGASKEAMENTTRILTPEMMKFGTRLQTQPNCIICQEDFITNVNKHLKSKTKSNLCISNTLKEGEGEESTKSVDKDEQNNAISTDDDNIRLMPCGHIFHESCIFQWLKDNNTCPVCRYELETDDEEYNEGVHKRMAERGIDIPAFNIDFTFFCSLEKCGQCKFISNTLKRRIEGSLPKCNSIENLISHSITQSNTINMRYTRLPCCNHEFHWPCLKEALLKAGYHWEDDNLNVSHLLSLDKKSLSHAQASLLKSSKTNDHNSIATHKIECIENDIIVTDLEEEEEESEVEEEIDYSIQGTSRKPITKNLENEEWIEIKCPVCSKINKLPIKTLKSNEQTKSTTINRSRSMTTLPKSLSIEKLKVKRLNTYNSLMNLYSTK